jgi:hypothetical protein
VDGWASAPCARSDLWLRVRADAAARCRFLVMAEVSLSGGGIVDLLLVFLGRKLARAGLGWVCHCTAAVTARSSPGGEGRHCRAAPQPSPAALHRVVRRSPRTPREGSAAPARGAPRRSSGIGRGPRRRCRPRGVEAQRGGEAPFDVARSRERRGAAALNGIIAAPASNPLTALRRSGVWGRRVCVETHISSGSNDGERASVHRDRGRTRDRIQRSQASRSGQCPRTTRRI